MSVGGVNLVLDGPVVTGAVNDSGRPDQDSYSQHWAAFALQEGHMNYDVPRNDEATLYCPDKDKWALARAEELEACQANSTWGPLVELPQDKHYVNLGFIYNLKKSSDSSAVRYVQSATCLQESPSC